MALKLNETYPGRFNNPTADYPQGSFKNRTTPTSEDGSYFEQQWANDKEGFFQRLMLQAGFTANGSVDTAQSSQYYSALLKVIADNAADKINAAIVTIAAASTINLTTGAPNTSQLAISGTGVSINGFTVAANRFFVVKMTGASNVLVNSASFVTGTGANVNALAGDTFLMRSTAANQVEILCYSRASSNKSRCTAWVNFNGTGTIAIRDAYNVSSLVDNGVGDYTINFSTNMDDTNYCCVPAFANGTATPYAPEILRSTVLIGSVRISQLGSTNGPATGSDWANCNVSIFGGKL